MVWNQIPDYLEAPASSSRMETLYFVTAISTSLDAKDFLTNAYSAYSSAMEKPEHLLHSHLEAWKDVWDLGRIDVEGNLPLAQTVYSGLYYMLR